jgi:hypothetical protein
MNCRQSRHTGILYLAILACLLCIAAPAAATPPTDIVLAYNNATGQLSATITHPVPNPDVHYIKNVLVKLNDQTVINAGYTSQPTQDTFTYTYPLPAKAGDTISVTATCSLFGSLTRGMVVPGPGATGSGQTAAAAPSPTPKAAAGLLPLALAIVLVVCTKKLK